MRCECVANGLQQRGGHSANTWQTDCNNVANIRRIRGERIATMLRTICNNVANIPQMRGEQFATMQHSKNKNHTFVTQKPPFCTSKTILLHDKNHTFVMRICNIQKTNTLRTFHKCVANTPKWVAKHSARRRGPIHRARILTSSNTCFHITKYVFSSPFRGCLRICRHDKSDPLQLLTVCNNATNKLQ